MDIDEPKRMTSTSEPECVFRLRKAHFHIRAITSWAVDTDALHVMAPDIRAAKEQLVPIFVEFLNGDLHKDSLVQQQRATKDISELLAHLSHPTPMILIHRRDLGGLGQADTVMYFLQLYWLLCSLVVEYAGGLDVISEVLGHSKESEALNVFNKVSADMALISPDVFLQFVGSRT